MRLAAETFVTTTARRKRFAFEWSTSAGGDGGLRLWGHRSAPHAGNKCSRWCLECGGVVGAVLGSFAYRDMVVSLSLSLSSLRGDK